LRVARFPLPLDKNYIKKAINSPPFDRKKTQN